ncbi:MAG: trypsin-like peptidase domain-containing protein [Pseudomonadota bacterium]
MRLFCAFCAAILLTTPASAEPAQFPVSKFGSVDMTLTESLGGATAAALKRGNLFYRIGRLRPDDPIRIASDAIVRLDMIKAVDGKEGMSTCTASIISEQLVLTNYHCIPGFRGTVKAAGIMLDYFTQGDRGAKLVRTETAPILSDADLDFAVVRLTERLPRPVRPLPLQEVMVRPGERLVMIHHPAGQPKMMTSHDCRVHGRNEDPAVRHVFHVCDTLPGSSGGIILSGSTLQPAALHYAGGLLAADPDSFNRATSAAAFFAQLRTLTGTPNPPVRRPGPATAQAQPVETTPRPARSSVDSINDFINN